MSRRQTKDHAKQIQRRTTTKQKYVEKVKTKQTHTKSPDQLKLLTNPEDTPKNPLTFHRLMEWLADTGWVEGYVRKRISPMDANLIEDYTQSVWECILRMKPDYVMNSWKTGKGKFVNLMKCVIDLQLRCAAQVYKENKQWHHIHTTITDEQWELLENGNRDITWTDRFPVKYNCPSGNRKKMVKVEYEDLPTHVETELTDAIYGS